MGPEDVTEISQSHDNTFTDEELLLINEQREWFLRWNLLSVKMAVKSIDITTQDLECHKNLADKASKIASNFEKVSRVGNILSNSITWYRQIIFERKSQSIQQTLLLSYFKKLPLPPKPLATTTLISQQSLTSGQDFHQ